MGNIGVDCLNRNIPFNLSKPMRILPSFCAAALCGVFLLRSPELLAKAAAVAKPATSMESVQSDLETASNLSALVKTLSTPPVSPLKARKLLKIYEYCGLFAGPKTRKQWMELFLPTVKANDPYRARRIELANAGYSRCEALLIATPDVYEIRAQWLKAAAAGDDVVAQLMLRQLSSPAEESIAGFEDELKRALNSRDPEAIWEAARAISLAGFAWGNLSKNPWPSGEVDSLRAVFQLAACELGMPCGAQSTLIKNFCIRGTCAAQSYAEWLPTFLSAPQFQAVKAELPRVVREIKAGRGASLIFH